MRLFKKFTQTFCKVLSKRFSRTHCSQLAQRVICTYTLLGISTNKRFGRTHTLSLIKQENTLSTFSSPLLYSLLYSPYTTIHHPYTPLYTLPYTLYTLLYYTLYGYYTPLPTATPPPLFFYIVDPMA